MHNLPSNPFPNNPSPDDAKARHEASVALSRTTALLQNDDFRWFLDTCIQPEIDTARENALSTSESEEKCATARHVHAAMVRVSQWVEQSRDSALSIINA